MPRLLILVMLSAAALALEVSEKTFKQLRKAIAPRKEELTWTKIPWASSLRQGMVDAHRQERPILLWTMNGHPLACT